MKQVGIAGTGKMGHAMARRLMDQGYSVTVWNRTSSKTADLIALGAHAASTPSDLARACEFVITSLTDGAALREVYEGGAGLLSAAHAQLTFIEMSTVSPSEQVRLSQAARAGGAAYVECPVGGTVGPALDGKLLGVAGSDEVSFQRALPILNVLCRRVELVGGPGAGAAMKLAINLPLAVYWQALGEALSLLSGSGISPRLAVEILADSSGAPTVLRNRIEPIAQALHGAPAPGTYDIDAMRKDLRTMLQAARELQASLPLAEKGLACLDEGAKAGLGTSDGIAQAAYWRDRNQR